jgi:hypothetical protein
MTLEVIPRKLTSCRVRAQTPVGARSAHDAIPAKHEVPGAFLNAAQ